MDPLQRIIGVEKLSDIFGGCWPMFHDAEVIWIRLDRGCISSGVGPTLEALIHAFEMTNEVGQDGYFVLRNHVHVRMRFQDVEELRLDGFNYQNVLFGLSISNLDKPNEQDSDLQVRFDSSFGVEATFQCRTVEVVSVDPCGKDGAPL